MSTSQENSNASHSINQSNTLDWNRNAPQSINHSNAGALDWKGAGVVCYIYDASGRIHVLVGKETKYLSDYCAVPSQKVNAPTAEKAHEMFSNTCKLLGPGITYDTPIDRGNNVYTAHYRCIPRPPDTPFWGIPKGCADVLDATPKDTVEREFLEEVGFPIAKEHLHPLTVDRNYIFYTYRMNTFVDVPRLKEILKERKESRYGELQDIHFMPLDYIKKNFSELNGLTKKVMGDLLRKLTQREAL